MSESRGCPPSEIGYAFHGAGTDQDGFTQIGKLKAGIKKAPGRMTGGLKCGDRYHISFSV